MANENDENDNPDPGFGFIVWLVLGMFAGGFLSWQYQIAVGADSVESMPDSQWMTWTAVLLAPFALFWAIGLQLGREARREKITWATYWTTTFSVAVAVFTLLGITGIDDLIPAQ